MTIPTPPTSWFGKTRDRLAYRVANAALRCASPYYRAFVGGAIEYGMASARRDTVEGRPSPPPAPSAAATTEFPADA